MRGRVHDFDADRGLGSITPADGGAAVPFHCTQIADGTRLIDVGAEVTYDLLPKLGRWEATAITVAA